MFSALRRAWQRYLASIPVPQKEEHVSDTDAMHELRPPPVDRKVVSTFGALASNVLSHIPEDNRVAQSRKLKSRLKRGTSPAEALGAWIQGSSGLKSTLGVIAVDWKAREEISWQAKGLCAAHGVSMDWQYDHRTDEDWKNWQERGEAPVDSPLRAFGITLQRTGLAFFHFSVGDTVFAFAVAESRRDEVLNLCKALDIGVVVSR
jgi:hypothetical protein